MKFLEHFSTTLLKDKIGPGDGLVLTGIKPLLEQRQLVWFAKSCLNNFYRFVSRAHIPCFHSIVEEVSVLGSEVSDDFMKRLKPCSLLIWAHFAYIPKEIGAGDDQLQLFVALGCLCQPGPWPWVLIILIQVTVLTHREYLIVMVMDICHMVQQGKPLSFHLFGTGCTACCTPVQMIADGLGPVFQWFKFHFGIRFCEDLLFYTWIKSRKHTCLKWIKKIFLSLLLSTDGIRGLWSALV